METQKVLEKFEPYIRNSARKYCFRGNKYLDNGVDEDDVVQEGRIVLLEALKTYDEKRGYNLESYIGVLLRNTFISIRNKLLSDRRRCNMCLNKMPSRFSCDICGETLIKRKYGWICKNANCKNHEKVVVENFSGRKQMETMNEIPDNNIASSPYKRLLDKQHSSLLLDFEKELFNSLNDVQKRIYSVMYGHVDNTCRYENLEDDKLTIKEASELLNMTENQVSWGIFNIKKEFTRISKKKKFISLYGSDVNNKRWPLIFISKGWNDENLINKVIKSMSLGDKKTKNVNKENKEYARNIDYYDWGAIMSIKSNLNKECYTVVMVGKFDAIYGLVFGSIGTREHLSVKWYGKLSKSLRAGDD